MRLRDFISNMIANAIMAGMAAGYLTIFLRLVKTPKCLIPMADGRLLVSEPNQAIAIAETALLFCCLLLGVYNIIKGFIVGPRRDGMNGVDKKNYRV